jgi:hypothetical protein
MPLFQSLSSPAEGLSGDGTSDSEDTDQDQPRKRRRVSVAELPTGSLAWISYVRVYANCRVRRLWFVGIQPCMQYDLCSLNKSAGGERTLETMGAKTKDEWGLYAAHAPV